MAQTLRKEREMVNTRFDSAIWNDIELRDDDIVIASWAKSGYVHMRGQARTTRAATATNSRRMYGADARHAASSLTGRVVML